MKRDIILTAKNDRRVEFYDGATHARLAALEMPAPVHELALTRDAATAYGSVFFQNSNNSVRVTGRNVSASTVDLAATPLAVQVVKRRVPYGRNLRQSKRTPRFRDALLELGYTKPPIRNATGDLACIVLDDGGAGGRATTQE